MENVSSARAEVETESTIISTAGTGDGARRWDHGIEAGHGALASQYDHTKRNVVLQWS